jgi:uncharacterized integral membrane protein (TIGR00698 family)
MTSLTLRPLSSAAAFRFLPGLLLCLGVTLAALLLEHLEATLFGRAWLEALVLAILLGTALRSLWTPGPRFKPGIDLSAKLLLEIAVMLLGASVSAATVLAVGPGMLLGIALVVAAAIGASFLICRLLGLPRRMAILVACGNSICGNSAIAAVAPVIGAQSRDVAAAIAFTAVLGVAVVLLLPLSVPLLGLSVEQFGVLAGLTVYAVPQVLAATVPVAPLAAQIGTLVKLVRVLMLGPVVVALSLLAPRLAEPGEARGAATRPPLHRLVPWFILGFLALGALRSLGLLPAALLAPMAAAATALTVISMAALGLGVDLRMVSRAGPRVTAAVTLSLLVLAGVSAGLIRLMGIA